MKKKYATYGVAFSPEDIAYYENLRKKKIVHYVWMTLIYLVLFIWSLFAIFPLIWTFLSSFKGSTSVVQNPFHFAFAEMSTGNYLNAFNYSDVSVWQAYWNSIYTSTLIVVMTLIVSIMTGFCLARINFRGHKIVEMAIVACMMFPAFSIIMPLWTLMGKLGLKDTHWAIMLPQVALNMGFTTILLTGFFKSLPLEVEESAFIDGASMPRIIVQIILPMMKSALITSTIFVFLWSYNDLFIQVYMIDTKTKYLLPYLMLAVRSEKIPDNGLMAAVSCLVAGPMLVIYFFLQKNIIKGLTAGAVKG